MSDPLLNLAQYVAGTTDTDEPFDAERAHQLQHNLNWLADASMRPLVQNELVVLNEYADADALYAAYPDGTPRPPTGTTLAYTTRLPWHPGCSARFGPWPMVPDRLSGSIYTPRAVNAYVRMDGGSSTPPITDSWIVAALVAGEDLPQPDSPALVAVAEVQTGPADVLLPLRPAAQFSTQGPGSQVWWPGLDRLRQPTLQPLYLWVGVRRLGASSQVTLTIRALEVLP